MHKGQTSYQSSHNPVACFADVEVAHSNGNTFWLRQPLSYCQTCLNYMKLFRSASMILETERMRSCQGMITSNSREYTVNHKDKGR